MNYLVRHRTRYAYSDSISLSHNEARLTPRSIGRQQVQASELTIDPKPDILHERVDFFGNRVHFFTIERPHQTLEVIMESRVSLDASRTPLPASPPWEEAARLARGPGTSLNDRQFLLDSPLVAASKALRDYALPSFAPGRPLLDAVEDLNHRIFEEFEFEPDFTDVTTPLSEVLEHRAGVCQDFAQLGIGCLRSLGLAARYVSGYIETLAPPGKERLVGADASHAWLSVLAPGLGWYDFDPTNDQRPAERHILTATGRDFTDATPLKGVLYGGMHMDLKVEVDVLPIQD